jgi:hypothetical protein
LINYPSYAENARQSPLNPTFDFAEQIDRQIALARGRIFGENIYICNLYASGHTIPTNKQRTK